MKTILALLALFTLPLMAATVVTLAWDANPESNISGYELSYGTASENRPNVIDAGPSTTVKTPPLKDGGTYYFAVRAKNTEGAYSDFSDQISYTLPNPSPLGWGLYFADSEEINGYQGELAIDGDPSTFWHTAWRPDSNKTPLPHEIQIDMRAVKSINAFTYLPRQDEHELSNIREYEFYTSLDGMQWGQPAAVGSFNQGKQLSTVTFPAHAARYFRLVAKSNHSNGSDSTTSIAEISVIEAAVIPRPSAPKGFKIVVEATVTVLPN